MIDNLANFIHNFLVFSLLSDLFFPKDFFDTYLSGDFFASKVRRPDIPSPAFDQILVSANYYQVEKLLERAKFGAETAIIPDFATIMTKNLLTQIDQKTVAKPDLLIFVPADTKRFSQRNYHLPQILAEQISRQTGILCQQILQKTKTTEAQTHLDRQKRLLNLENSFELLPVSLTKMRTICLIDDVATTGTTLNECAKIILEHNPFLEIYALVLASN